MAAAKLDAGAAAKAAARLADQDPFDLLVVGSGAGGLATAVAAEGRITPGCTGIWNDAQRDALAKIAAFLHAQG